MLETMKVPPSVNHPAGPAREAVQEYERLLREHADAVGRRFELDQQRGDAEREDRRRLGAALRAGEADPGTALADAVDDELAVVARRIDGLEEAVRAAGNDLRSVFVENLPALVSTVDAEVEAGRARVLDLIREMGAAKSVLAGREMYRLWLTRFGVGAPTKWSDTPGSGWLPTLHSANGQPVAVDAVLQAMADAVTPRPEPVEEVVG